MADYEFDVLTKYYNTPHKYMVYDGCVNCIGRWDLPIDNDHNDYVVVWLYKLKNLPNIEQKYWRTYNIEPSHKKGISKAMYDRSVMGRLSNPISPDLYFKQKYNKLNKSWDKKYGWNLFLPLTKADEHNFFSLRGLTSDNQKEFDEGVLSLAKILIDSLNEVEFSKEIQTLENDKGIDKFEKYLKSKNFECYESVNFLRDLQKLRSSSSAHRKSRNTEKQNKLLSLFW